MTLDQLITGVSQLASLAFAVSTMLAMGMGLTLRFVDFAAVVREPKHVALGVGAQFLIMPLAGWGIASGRPDSMQLLLNVRLFHDWSS